MTKSFLAVASVAILFSSKTSYGFGKKMMQISELKGVTESQVAVNENQAHVFVRGKAAELLFKVMKDKQEEQIDTEALKWMGSKNGAQFTVKGKQITCTRVTNQKAEDYACAFDIDQTGSLTAVNEAFVPETFNLARTETGSKLFKKKKGRAVASATSFNKGLAYLVYEKPGEQRRSENAMIVLKGESAKDLLTVLEMGAKEGHWGDAAGRKGHDIACVGATAKEPERCAVVVSFKDGSTTTSGNPLYQ
jgi:hypothetical protein